MAMTAESILAMSGSYWLTCTLHAGVKLDLFTLIGRNVLTAEALRQAVGGSERGVPMLLNALTAMGLLVRKGDAYANTDEGWTLLSKDSPGYIGHIILHHHHLVASWNHLAEAVLTGELQRSRPSSEDESERESFLNGDVQHRHERGPAGCRGGRSCVAPPSPRSGRWSRGPTPSIFV